MSRQTHTARACVMASGCLRRRAAGGVAAVLLAAVLAVLSISPAWGHASGELPRAQLRAEGPRIHLEFMAPPDDAAAIGTEVGLLGEGAMLALLGGPDEDLPSADEVAVLSSSPELRDYLEDHITVSQDGTRCPGQASPAPDFLSDGAELEFRCPEPVEQAHIRITVLHDVDPAYRTFTVDGSDQYAIHSAAAPEHPWDFTRSEAARVDPTLLTGVIVAVVVLAAGAWVVRPRRREVSR